LQNVVRRVADQWRPASSAEAYQIVRQRLFKQPDAAALASIGATARAYVDMYRKYTDDFPANHGTAHTKTAIKRTYPIHPELFDRLYEEWSSLERFQRTRGVLRLMSTVFHALWTGEDASPLIMPGSIPLATANGQKNRRTHPILQDLWKASSTPMSMPQLGVLRGIDKKNHSSVNAPSRNVSRVPCFFGAAPTIGSAHKD